jgi:NAD(P)H-hydrate repair Nnr-like enzyme with NAD(P)H-hydrate dehydratase domain
MAFHYLQPIAHWNETAINAVLSAETPPRLIADAGFMYAAKMSGHAGRFDLFTPDMGELAFLADESAPHPFYTRGFVLHEGNERAPELISRAYLNNNASRYLLVKGARDYVADRKGIITTVGEPSVPALEPIGGTGDTVTGIVSALMEAGYGTPRACAMAAMTNRRAGSLANPTPATQVAAIVDEIPRALGEVLLQEEGREKACP